MHEPNTQFDIVVIGAGSGGLTAAVGCAKIGKRVLLVEREHMGGECTNTGCIPSKALLHHAKQYHAAVQIAGKSSQSAAYRQRAFTYVRDIIAATLEEEQEEHFTALGITVLWGEARFVGPCVVEVDSVQYRFKTAIIATGSAPRRMEIPGLDGARMLTNQNLFALSEIPERTLILGSGPIGMEMGQALALLGSQVTIATIDSEFARLEDDAIRAIVQEVFHSLGVNIELQAHITHVADGVAHFERRVDGEVKDRFVVPFDTVLVAIGRVPHIPDGLEQAGVAYD